MHGLDSVWCRDVTRKVEYGLYSKTKTHSRHAKGSTAQCPPPLKNATDRVSFPTYSECATDKDGETDGQTMAL